MSKYVIITMSFEIPTSLRDNQDPEEVVMAWASGYLLQNAKLINVVDFERTCKNCSKEGILDVFMCPGKNKCILDRDWKLKED